MLDLGQSFLRGIAGAYDLADDIVGKLGPSLAEHLTRARATWPNVHLDGEDFAQHLAACAPDARDPAEALAAMHTSDLYLAAACAAGLDSAIAAFESEVMSQVPRAVSRVDSNRAFIENVMEEVRVKLLVGDGRAPRISTYLGRGPLSSWVMVVAVRTAYGIKRKRGKEIPTPELDVPLLQGDAELAHLRKQVREPFGRAFRAALAELSTRDRNVLRLYLIEEVGTESIARMYRVHRATVARWIARSRDSVANGTRKRLRKELSLSDGTFESLVRKIVTGLDLSLASFLEDN